MLLHSNSSMKYQSIFSFLFWEKQDLMYPRLISNSLCSQGCLWTSNLPVYNSGTTGMCHHAQFMWYGASNSDAVKQVLCQWATSPAPKAEFKHLIHYITGWPLKRIDKPLGTSLWWWPLVSYIKRKLMHYLPTLLSVHPYACPFIYLWLSIHPYTHLSKYLPVYLST